jgi:hypothetical protein
MMLQSKLIVGKLSFVNHLAPETFDPCRFLPCPLRKRWKMGQKNCIV